LKNTGFIVSLRSWRAIDLARTANTMLLHRGDPLECETGRINHEGEFCIVNPLDVITFYGNDEKDEKDQVAKTQLVSVAGFG
jgi:hypothetical protein